MKNLLMNVPLLALFLFAAPALAADAQPGKSAPSHAIDFSQYLIDEDGKPFADQFQFDRASPDKKLPDLTLGAAACHALNAATPDEQNLGFEKRIERGFLCRKVKGQVNASLEAGEIDLIKKRIGAVYTNGVLVMSAACMLDPATPGC